MRAVIDNRVYDTDTSRYSISWSEKYYNSEEEYWCVMYVKRTGEYFVHRIHKTEPDDIWYDKLHKELELQTDDWFSITPIHKDLANHYYEMTRKNMSGTKCLIDKRTSLSVWGDYKNNWEDLTVKLQSLIKDADILPDNNEEEKDKLANLVKVEWEVRGTYNEYVTVWITYTIGSKSLRKWVRLYSQNYRHLYVTNKDFWFVLRYLIGDTLEKEREDGKITMNRLKNIIKDTNQFYSECWDEWLHDFAWHNHYGNNPEKPWLNELVEKYGDEYEEGSSLVGFF